MLEFEYARSALKNGLKLEQELGVNPYKFGMVGSTDAHTGLAAVEEDNFFGKTIQLGAQPGTRYTILHEDSQNGERSWAGKQTASGYAAVWATRTRARPSSMPCSARRPTPPPARA